MAGKGIPCIGDTPDKTRPELNEAKGEIEIQIECFRLDGSVAKIVN